MGANSRFFPKTAARMRCSQLAADLIPFIQWLHAGAILKIGLDQGTRDRLRRGERPVDLEAIAIDAPKMSLLYEMNLILQACLGNGIRDPDRIFGIAAYVMTKTHDLYSTESGDLVFWGIQWCGAVEADLDSAAGATPLRSSESDRAVFLASRKTAIRFCDGGGIKAAKPTEQEIMYFASLCTPADTAV
jgi:hypothetical protein